MNTRNENGGKQKIEKYLKNEKIILEENKKERKIKRTDI